MFENIQRGVYLIRSKDGTYWKEYYFRSKWEANYALYLQWLKDTNKIFEWEYEPQPYYEFPIKHGSTRYLPDFRITNNDGTFYLVELKGFKQGMVKLKRMAKYFPKVKIELVDAKEYRALQKKVGKMLHFY